MTYHASTYLEAVTIARRLRAVYGRDGWRVDIIRPLFEGDRYTITVS